MNFGALVVRADRIREFLRARVAAMNGGRLFPVGRAGSSLERIARPRAGGERIGGGGAGGEGGVGRGPRIKGFRFVRVGRVGPENSLLRRLPRRGFLLPGRGNLFP